MRAVTVWKRQGASLSAHGVIDLLGNGAKSSQLRTRDRFLAAAVDQHISIA
jgi:hypothetical protein